MFVAFGEDLKDELRGAGGQREIAKLIKHDKLCSGVARDDAGEFAAALGFLEFVGERGERGEADASSGLARAEPTRAGFDRDEYPPAVGRGRGPRALTRGINPVGWRADVAYVRSGENRSHGSSLGGKLRRFCNGTKFRYAFR